MYYDDILRRDQSFQGAFIEMSEISIWLPLCFWLLASDELDLHTISR